MSDVSPEIEDILKPAYKQKYELCPRLIDLNRHAKVQDEIVSVFISAMMGHIVKSWEAVPCIGKKLKRPSWLENPERAESSSYVIGENEEEHRESSIAHMEEALRSSTAKKTSRPSEVSKILDSVELSREGEDPFSLLQIENFKANSLGQVIPPYAPEWIAVSNDPTVLMNDWRFHEGDQLAIIEFKNGNKYRGRLSRNVMHGEGVFFWANGTVYTGSFNCGDITGRGTIRWPDLSWYEGDVYYGYRHGNGLLVLAESLAYFGDWAQGIRHGQGLLMYDTAPIRNCYDVTWKKGICSGNGLRIYPSGAQYDGQWKNGLKDGYGVMIWSNGDVYIGDWVKGKMEGIGKYIWYAFMSNDFVIPARNSYYGTWVENKKHGVGILETISGVCIKGEWNNDVKSGYGEIICRNGIHILKNPLFDNDHLKLLKFNENHPWAFMMKLDNMNILKHNAGFTLDKDDSEKKRSKPSGSKDSVCNDSTEYVLHRHDSLSECKTQANLKFNPTTVSSEYIDLSYYLMCLRKSQEIMKKNFNCNKVKEKKTIIFDELKAPQLKIRIHRGSEDSIKKSIEYDPNEPFQFYSFESKWLRNVILRHLPYLKKLYNDYAAMLCSNRPNYPVRLPRLLLWQMFRDFNIQKKGVVLHHIDRNIKNNPSTMIEDIRSPFEKIRFFQFLHYLIELSWEMYGKNRIGLQDTPGVLAAAFEKLIEDDIKPNARNHIGISLLIYRNLLPLNELYNKFFNQYRIDTVRKFLSVVLNLKPKCSLICECKGPHCEEEDSSVMSTIDYTLYKNIYDIGDQPNYKKMKLKSWKQIVCEKSLISVNLSDIDEEVIEKLNEETIKANSLKEEIHPVENLKRQENENGMKQNSANLTTTSVSTDRSVSVTQPSTSTSGNYDKSSPEDVKDASKYSLRNLDILSAMECIEEVCPDTKSNNLIVNINYQITFLEFFEMLVLCALKSIEIDKAEKEKKILTKKIESDGKDGEKHRSTTNTIKSEKRKNQPSAKKS